MAHTPGPWEARPTDGQIILNGSNAYDIQEIYNEQGGFNPEDIRLMAVAPELLARLRAMVSGMECECDTADPEHPLCDVCWSRQVIAKAEGKGE